MLNSFSAADTDLTKILDGIEEGEIQLPDFQRGWVWNDQRIQALIASILSGYPVGALMFLEYGGDSIRFNYRSFTGSDKDCEPETLVLDGQQRLTSVYTALFRKEPVPTKDDKGKDIERYYYLDIKKCLNAEIDDKAEAIISVGKDKLLGGGFGRSSELNLATPENEFEHLAFPLNLLFDNAGYIAWISKCQRFHKFEPDVMETLNEFQLVILGPIQKYEVPVIQLAKETPKEAVCQVFENVNTGGVTLTVFELVTASFAADTFDLRGDWEGGKNGTENCRKKRLCDASVVLNVVSATDFLMGITLLSRYYEWQKDGRNVSCKKKDILDLQLNDYKQYADKLEEGFIQAAHFLNEQRIFAAKDLPYTTQLVPLAVMFAILGNKASDSPVRAKLSQWYWCGVLGEMYGGASETRCANDVMGMHKWLQNDDQLPDTIARAYFQPTRLLSLQTRQSAAYKGVIALILKNGACDFISGRSIDFATFVDNAVDIHHVFPKAYCTKNDIPKNKMNCVVNKTPLSARTNRVIGSSAPSIYMAKLEKDGHVTAAELDGYVSTHEIDPALLRMDDFDGFFIQRAKSLVGLIGQAMGKPVTNLSGDDVVDAFGAALQ